jgi:pimeloyl-ACP methyl ester carboxylesterase
MCSLPYSTNVKRRFMMKKYKRLVWIAVLMTALVMQPAVTFVGASTGPMDLEGILKGAPYVIRVPEAWNGTLLVYAHGYSGDPIESPDAAFGGDPTETLLLEEGYALAASGFRGGGWTVGEGIKDTKRLVRLFRRQVDKPEYVILYGASMGTVVTLKSMEKYPNTYDGAVSLCSVGAGTTGNWDMKLVQSLAYDVAFGWPVEWGEVGDVKDDIDFDTEVFPKFISEFSDPANFSLFEFIRLVSSLPEGGYYVPAPPMPAPTAIINTMLFTAARAELEVRAGGSVAQNLDHVYSLSPEDTAYLEGMGVDVEALLAEMNATNIEANPRARAYLRRNADFNGRIHGPVVMLHNIVDSILPVEHTSAYMATVNQAGKEDMVVTAFTDLVGHCNFTVDQLLASIVAVEGWLDTGTPPDDGDFPEILDFVHGFEPGPWPQPPQK